MMMVVVVRKKMMETRMMKKMITLMIGEAGDVVTVVTCTNSTC